MATKRGDAAGTDGAKGATRRSATSPEGTAKSTRGAAKADGAAGAGKRAGTGTRAAGGAAAGRSGTTGEKAAKPAGRGAGRAGAGAGAATAGGARAKAGAGAKQAGGRGPDLTRDLRDFASTRPDGWSHDDWLQFLDHLHSRGHNVSDRDQIGSLLEGERLRLALQKIPGIGPARVKTIAERYGYLWRLRETDADQLAREADIPRNVAEKVLAGLRR